MAFKFKRIRRSSGINLPSFPDISASENAEQLSGVVDGMTASAPEERMALALRKAGIQFMFRYVIGAPKGLPGWKELDFLISSRGIIYAMEMDTAFTHRSKVQKDILHDALLQNDPEIQSYGTLWPEVLHVDGDSDAATLKNAERYVKQRFG